MKLVNIMHVCIHWRGPYVVLPQATGFQRHCINLGRYKEEQVHSKIPVAVKKLYTY